VDQSGASGSARSIWENIAVGHPDVMEAAVIGVRHRNGTSRPLLIVVKKSGADVGKDSISSSMSRSRAGRPRRRGLRRAAAAHRDGKLSKITLREQFKIMHCRRVISRRGSTCPRRLSPRPRFTISSAYSGTKLRPLGARSHDEERPESFCD